jgi:hypothetical protein
MIGDSIVHHVVLIGMKNKRRHPSGICGTFGKHVVLKTRSQIHVKEVTVNEEICLPILVNPMCKFFKQPTDPIEAEEPDLAN